MTGAMLPGQPLLALAVGNMAWASLFALVVLAIRRPFARAFGAGPTYALWLLPMLRLVAPPLPAIPSFWPSFSDAIPPQTIILSVEDAAAPLPPETPWLLGGPGQWVPILLALWALGAAALICWQMLAYRHFLARLSASARGVGEHDGLPLVASEAAEGPLAVGLIDRRIVVPADFFTRYAPGEQALALAHEAVHHRRGDLWWNHGALLILAVNWFNPVAWIAFRAFRADQELSCDAAVLTCVPAEARADYAHALVKSASRPGLIAACPLNHADQLKRRLRMMKDHRRSIARRVGGAGAFALLAGVGVVAGAPVLAEEVVVHTAAMQTAAPTAPATPTPPATGDAQPQRERIIIHTERREAPSGAAPRSGATGEPQPERRERILILNGGPNPNAAAGERPVVLGRSSIRISDGPDGRPRIDLPRDCAGAGQQVASGQDGSTNVILCDTAGGTPAERAGRLQRIRERMASEDQINADARTRALAVIDREIARLRGQ